MNLGRIALQKLGWYGLYSLKIKGPLLEDGWFRSFDEARPVDVNGEPVPFITYPAIEFLSRRVRPDMTVFEYGCGASTLWWAKRVKEVRSAEHNPDWFERISKAAPANVQVYFAALGEDNAYPSLALVPGFLFSVVVIDGRERVRCAKFALDVLRPEGVIVWDNTERNKYDEGFRLLAARGFRRVEFVGLSPGINERSETSIFYRDGNCMGL